MKYPSVMAIRIAKADPSLFEHLMGRIGMRLVRRNTDPLSTTVQNEAVDAIASVISEDVGARQRLPRYLRQLKEMAEKAGYMVVLEGPAWHNDDEFEHLQRDARDFEQSMSRQDGDMEDDVLDAGPEAGEEFGPTEQEPTGHDLLAQIHADVHQQDDQPPW